MTNIIITGASRGIGYATALRLSSNPANQIYVLSRNNLLLNQLVQEAITQHGHQNIHPVMFDLAVKTSYATLSPMLEKVKHVDCLINNAGVLVNKPFMQHTEEDWYRTFETNFFGVIRLIQVVQPFMGKQAKSHILNISSMGGFQGSQKFPGLTAYSTSKAAISNLTECLAQEFSQENMAVNCLALGAVQTEMLQEAFPNYQAPLSSEQMAEFISYFALNGHYFFNGKIIPVALSTP